MKSIVMPKTVQLAEKKEQTDNFLQPAEVKEAPTAEAGNNKVKFTAVDMWNHQRNCRSASAMLRRWNLN